MDPTRSDRGSALWTVLIFLVLLSGLVAAAWPVYTGQRERLKIAADKLEAAHQKIGELSLRPTDEQLNIHTTRAAEATQKLAETESALAQATAKVEQLTAREATLGTDLARATARLDELDPEAEQLRAAKDELEKVKLELTTELKSLRAKYENVRIVASDKAEVLARLDAATTKVSELEVLLDVETAKLAEKSVKFSEVDAKLAAARQEIAGKDASLSELKSALAEIPIAPLPDALAEQKYREYLNKVAVHTDREGRISMFFRAKIALSGSSYEDKADGQWRNEIKMKQVDSEKAARLVYEDVSTKLRVHPDAHDENVKLLEESLAKVMGTKYEKVVQQLIDREHELKAAGR
jgi:hypothetical protein